MILQTNILIICNIHGIFEQNPINHTHKKYGCPHCSKNKKETTKSFISKAKKIHGDLYDYSLVDYINSNTKIKIICSVHGVFEQLPSNHLCGKICYMCVGKQKTTEDFIKEANIIHNNKYDYSLT